MMDLAKEFELAAATALTLKTRPDHEKLLRLYSLYKQAKEGDVKGERPRGFDFKSIAKYDAWASMKGKGQETCMKEYIELVNSLS